MKGPDFKQKINLRTMIVIGLGLMVFFLYKLLQPQVMGNKTLYWLLMVTFIFSFFKIGYEWYHYWSVSIPNKPKASRQYTVDIFTTFCAGEPYNMIEQTLRAVKNITYPHQTYLCDEANDAYLKALCHELGIHHVTRTLKINAKAGNINNALQQSTGELCVVLDPDHVPAPNFLDQVVDYFENEEIGYVQVVQAYYNQEDSWVAKGAAQQTYQFYGPMMMCMNSYGTVQAIGANCTFRRTALESIGGHAAGLAEDMHTAMQMHAKGWKSLYVPEVLTRGLVPATLSAYYKQQLKWSRGVFELLFTSYISLFKKFTWRQKLHYGLLPLFYISGFIFLINFLIPVISLFTGLYPLKIDFTQFVLISVPYVTAVILIRHYVQQWVMEDRERGFHIVGGLLLIGTWWVFITGVVYTFFRKKVPYIPTPKDLNDPVNFKINLPNIAVLLLSMLAIAYGITQNLNPYTIFMAGIAGLNCLLMFFVLVSSAQIQMRNYQKRHQLVQAFLRGIHQAKGHFWLLRRKVYASVRAGSLAMVLGITTLSIAGMYNGSDGSSSIASFYPSGFLIGEFNITGVKPLVAGFKIDVAHTMAADAQERTPTVMANNFIFQSNNYGKPANQYRSAFVPQPSCYRDIHGVIYSKGNYWFKNAVTLDKRAIAADFAEMKRVGINTVKLYGPGIYDKTLLNEAAESGLKIQYSFWIPSPAAFVNDFDYLYELSDDIISVVNAQKSNPTITSWSLSNTALQQLDEYYKQPQLNVARKNYIRWMKQLVEQIKQQDPSRSLSAEVMAAPGLYSAINLLKTNIPALDAYGLVLTDEASLTHVTDSLKVPFYFSNANPRAFTNGNYPAQGVFYANWQDQLAASSITVDGLKGIYGRNKPYLHAISQAFHGNIAANHLPAVKILRPAISTAPGAKIPYQALVFMQNKWHLAAYLQTGLNYEWYMVRSNEWGKPIHVEKVGSGPTLKLAIPDAPSNYHLYLIAAQGHNINEAYSALDIPFYQ
ncbi:glycosyltransferase [Mucilaginibacter sp. CSA2-8R]|uniref:glycosyltransferase n=1 Tax=Mucilaginibacter sp. CSA2-8R TaxID=3141542 RepID=UPI00315D95D3